MDASSYGSMEESNQRLTELIWNLTGSVAETRKRLGYKGLSFVDLSNSHIDQSKIPIHTRFNPPFDFTRNTMRLAMFLVTLAGTALAMPAAVVAPKPDVT